MRLFFLAFPILLAATVPASAAILVTFQQVGANLVMTAAGTYDFTGVTSTPDIGIGLPAVFRADTFIFGWETATNRSYTGTFTGTLGGNSELASTNIQSATIPFYVTIKTGAAPGEGTFFLKDTMPLSGSVSNTATFTNQSLSSLGLTQGQSTTLNLAGGNSVTFSVIPEPSTVLAGALGALGLLRRRR